MKPSSPSFPSTVPENSPNTLTVSLPPSPKIDTPSLVPWKFVMLSLTVEKPPPSMLRVPVDAPSPLSAPSVPPSAPASSSSVSSSGSRAAAFVEGIIVASRLLYPRTALA